DARQELVEAVAKLVKERDDLVVRERRRCVARGRGKIAVQVRDGQLHLVTRTAAIDGVVLPRAALLAGTGVKVEIELADQRARRIEDVEEGDVGMPRRRLALSNRDAVERLRHAE